MSTMKRKLRKLTDAQEAKVQAQIASDADATEASDAALKKAKPFAQAFPDLAESIRRGRGRPALANPRQQISLRLDGDVIAKFKSTGKGWQGRINGILKRSASRLVLK